MGRIYIAPYKMASESAKALAQAMSILRVTGDKSFKRSDTIVNWGSTTIDIRGTDRILNHPSKVMLAKNKLLTFQCLYDRHVPTVEWTTDKDKVSLWLDSGEVVYARTVISGSAGQGIVVLKDIADWQDATLYTKGMKAHEYRVHVMLGKVIDVQKKRRRNDVEANDYIKNADNGWVFCRDNVTAPKELYDAAVNAVAALGLHFGAVDVLYSEKKDVVAVLEVNTSPGIEGTTLTNYCNSLRGVYGMG